MLTLKPAVMWSAVALLISANLARAESVPTLDGALRDKAKDVLATLKKRDYKNVGVLKFMVGNEGGKLRDNYGPINRSLSDRLELALLLALQKGDDFGVIFRASDAVKEKADERATHLTPEGRAVFFSFKRSPFHLPWNPEVKVQPDAFLTGEARLTADLRYLDVVIQVFDKKTPAQLTELTRFRSIVDLRTLTEAGVSYVGSRGPFGEGTPIETPKPVADGFKNDGDVKPSTPNTKDEWDTQTTTLLAKLRTFPLKVEVLYNDKVEPVEKNPFGPPTESPNVKLRLSEPKQNTKVAFRITNTGTETYGTVLLINGVNSIQKEQNREPLDCYKWILAPKQTVTIRGFQVTNSKSLDFDVKSEAESSSLAVNYGDNAGTFAVVVFRAATTEKDLEMINRFKKLSEENTETATISRGTASLTESKITASDPIAFQTILRNQAMADVKKADARGIVGEGAEGVRNVKDVKFQAFPYPVLSATIRYAEAKK